MIPVAVGVGAGVLLLLGGAAALFRKSDSGSAASAVKPIPKPLTPAKPIVTADPVATVQAQDKGMDTALARAVVFANNNVSDPKALQEFGSVLLPEFPAASKLLILKSSSNPATPVTVPKTVPLTAVQQKQVDDGVAQAKLAADTMAKLAAAGVSFFGDTFGGQFPQLNYGASLGIGDSILSQDGRARLTFQSDGNLVLVNTTNGNSPLWATMTQGRGGVKFTLQSDGNLVMTDRNGAPIWAAGTRGGSNASLVVQNDGNMVLINGNQNGNAWSSETAGFHVNRSVLPDTNIFQDALSTFEDFANTAVGGALLHILEVATFSELLTGLPGIGQLIGNTLASLGPVASDMLPGLAKGERVDRVFIGSLKSVTARALAAGGASGAAQVAGPMLQSSLSTANSALGSIGVSPKTFSDKMDQLRQQAGGLSKDAPLPAPLQQQYDSFVHAQLAKLPTTSDMAKKIGVPDDLMQVAIDGVTRSDGYTQNHYNADGSLRDAAAEAKAAADQKAADERAYQASLIAMNDNRIVASIDSDILSPRPGGFSSAADIYGFSRKNAGMYDGKYGNIPYGYIVNKLAYWAKNGKRTADTSPISKVLPSYSLHPANVNFPAVGSHAETTNPLSADAAAMYAAGVARGKMVAGKYADLNDVHRGQLAVYAVDHADNQVDAMAASFRLQELQAKGIAAQNNPNDQNAQLAVQVGKLKAQADQYRQLARGMTGVQNIIYTQQAAAFDAQAATLQSQIHGDFGIDLVAMSAGVTALNPAAPTGYTAPNQNDGSGSWNTERYNSPIIVWEAPIHDAIHSTVKVVGLLAPMSVVTVTGPIQKGNAAAAEDDFYPINYTDNNGTVLVKGYIAAKNLDGKAWNWGVPVVVDDQRYLIRARYVKNYNGTVDTLVNHFVGLTDAAKMQLALYALTHNPTQVATLAGQLKVAPPVAKK